MIDKFELSGELNRDCTSINLKFGKSLARVLSHMRDKDLHIKLSVLSYKRTDAQNRLYWGVCIPTIRAWHKETQGESITKDEAHAFVLNRVLKYKPKFKTILGYEVMYFDVKTTSQMNTKEFSEFYTTVQKYFAELDCEIKGAKGNNLTEDYI